jgi:hypothetical protein
MDRGTNFFVEEFPWKGDKLFSWSRNSLLLWNQKVHNCIYKSMPFYLILSWLNPADIFTFFFSKIHFHIPWSITRFPKQSPLLTFHDQSSVCISHFTHAYYMPCPYLIVHYVITLMIIDEEHKTEDWICLVEDRDQYWMNALMYLWVP